MAKRRTAFVPRAILATVVTVSVVPMLATASCGDDTGGASTEGGYVRFGVAAGGYGVAAVAYGGFSVAAVAYGGYGVAAVAFGGFGGAGGAGGQGGATNGGGGAGGTAMRMDGVHDWERSIVGRADALSVRTRPKKA